MMTTVFLYMGILGKQYHTYVCKWKIHNSKPPRMVWPLLVCEHSSTDYVNYGSSRKLTATKAE